MRDGEVFARWMFAHWIEAWAKKRGFWRDLGCGFNDDGWTVFPSLQAWTDETETFELELGPVVVACLPDLSSKRLNVARACLWSFLVDADLHPVAGVLRGKDPARLYFNSTMRHNAPTDADELAICADAWLEVGDPVGELLALDLAGPEMNEKFEARLLTAIKL